MKKLICCCVLFLMLLSGVANAAIKNDVTADKTPSWKIQHWKTHTGVNVYFVRAPELPMLDLQMTFMAGSVYDEKQPGLAELTNSMIGQGTSTMTANQVAAAFDQIGAQFSVSIDRDVAILSLRTLTEDPYLNKAISIFKQVSLDPSFSPQSLQRKKNQALASIKIGLQDPAVIATNAFYQAAYGNFGYAHDPDGTLTSIPKITRENVINFYRQYYVANNVYMVIVGDVTKTKAMAIANELTKQMPLGEPARTFHLVPKTSSPVIRHINFPSKQTAIMLGQIGITRNNSHYFPLIVGNHLFGGSGLTSILFKQIREKQGLAYSVGSQFVLLRYRGPYLLALQTKASQTTKALNLLKSVLEHFLKNGPNQAQLTATQLNMIGSFPIALDSNSKIEAIVSNIVFNHLPLDYLNYYRSYVKAVTLDQIKKAFQQEIQPNKLIIITVGPNQAEKKTSDKKN